MADHDPIRKQLFHKHAIWPPSGEELHFCWALRKQSAADMIYMDISNAFDKFNHDMICYKLQNLGIIGKLAVRFSEEQKSDSCSK